MITQVGSSAIREMIGQGTTFLVEVSAGWCHPCRILEKFLFPLSNEFPEFPFYKVDYDANTDIFEILEIGTVPYIVIFREGKAAVRIRGLTSENSIREALSEILKNSL